jgi:hypothetical protein
VASRVRYGGPAWAVGSAVRFVPGKFRVDDDADDRGTLTGAHRNATPGDGDARVPSIDEDLVLD